jgi:hypothetical protein
MRTRLSESISILLIALLMIWWGVGQYLVHMMIANVVLNSVIVFFNFLCEENK